jgi:hypothetical protein
LTVHVAPDVESQPVHPLKNEERWSPSRHDRTLLNAAEQVPPN